MRIWWKELADAEIAWGVAAVKSIRAAGEKYWRAHLALKERRIRERWAWIIRETAQLLKQSFA
jgi:hypothetical protein